jgi:hypothetical protein
VSDVFSMFEVRAHLTNMRSRCPGIHLAESSVWLVIVSMLSTLDIRKKRDERGVEIEPVGKFENSVFRGTPFFGFGLAWCRGDC